VFTFRAGRPFDEAFVCCGRLPSVSCLPGGLQSPGEAVTFAEEGAEGDAPSPAVAVCIHLLCGLLFVNICSVALVSATCCAVRTASLSSRRRLGEVALVFV
jgi:hypothetical protein